jgi:hypothetical protein
VTLEGERRSMPARTCVRACVAVLSLGRKERHRGTKDKLGSGNPSNLRCTTRRICRYHLQPKTARWQEVIEADDALKAFRHPTSETTTMTTTSRSRSVRYDHKSSHAGTLFNAPSSCLRPCSLSRDPGAQA